MSYTLIKSKIHEFKRKNTRKRNMSNFNLSSKKQRWPYYLIEQYFNYHWLENSIGFKICFNNFTDTEKMAIVLILVSRTRHNLEEEH